MTWEAIGVYAFWVFVAGAFLLFVGLTIGRVAAGPTQVEGMERLEFRDARDAAPPAEEYHFRVPPYVPRPIDPDLTRPMEKWERPQPPATYKSTNHWDDDPTRVDT